MKALISKHIVLVPMLNDSRFMLFWITVNMYVHAASQDYICGLKLVFTGCVGSQPYDQVWDLPHYTSQEGWEFPGNELHFQQNESVHSNMAASERMTSFPCLW